MPKLRSDGATTRSGLLEAAVGIVREDGWEAATTRSIAGRAGTTPGSVHYHFDSVDDLVFEAVSSYIGTSVANAMEGLDPADVATWGPALRELAPQSSGPDARLWLEICLRATHDDRVATWMRNVLTGARSDLAATLEDLDWAAGILALVDGLLLHKIIDPTLDVEAAFDALTQPKGTR